MVEESLSGAIRSRPEFESRLSQSGVDPVLVAACEDGSEQTHWDSIEQPAADRLTEAVRDPGVGIGGIHHETDEGEHTDDQYTPGEAVTKSPPVARVSWCLGGCTGSPDTVLAHGPARTGSHPHLAAGRTHPYRVGAPWAGSASSVGLVRCSGQPLIGISAYYAAWSGSARSAAWSDSDPTATAGQYEAQSSSAS
jgi:hypothetical protein